jgi:hypothetical protein
MFVALGDREMRTFHKPSLALIPAIGLMACSNGSSSATTTDGGSPDAPVVCDGAALADFTPASSCLSTYGNSSVVASCFEYPANTIWDVRQNCNTVIVVALLPPDSPAGAGNYSYEAAPCPLAGRVGRCTDYYAAPRCSAPSTIDYYPPWSVETAMADCSQRNNNADGGNDSTFFVGD